MPSVAQAAKDLNSQANKVGEAAKKYEKARERQDRAHERTVERYEEWREASPPSDAQTQALRRAQARENAAIQDTNMAADALAAAALAFSAAVAELMAAMAQP